MFCRPQCSLNSLIVQKTCAGGGGGGWSAGWWGGGDIGSSAGGGGARDPLLPHAYLKGVCMFGDMLCMGVGRVGGGVVMY